MDDSSQWVFQYMTDANVVRTLRQLKVGLKRGRADGVLVLKENRPYLAGHDERMFQVDTPSGEHGWCMTLPDRTGTTVLSLRGPGLRLWSLNVESRPIFGCKNFMAFA